METVKKEFVRFLNISKGPTAELIVQLEMTIMSNKYTNKEDYKK